MKFTKPYIKTIFSLILIAFLLPLNVFAQSLLTDPQIAHIVVTANNVDISAGKLAKLKSKNKEVKNFAIRMIADHSGVNKQANELSHKLNLKPEDNDSSRSLLAGGKNNIKQLKKLYGKKFDKHYIDQEVSYHEAVLDTIDKMLIPNAKNSELKALIEKVRPAILAHLEHAKSIQSSMNH